MVLWGGGIWNWLDPLTLVEAWPGVVAREPKARLVFLGTRHPNPEVPRHAMAERAEALAREIGELDRSIVFIEWVDVNEREALLCDADVGVSLHPIHVETRYSIRARVIDYFWARLPVVVTDGDVASEWVTRHGLGRVVPPHDVQAVGKALVSVLGRPRSSWSAAYDEIHAELRWARAVEPLRRYCTEGAPPAPDRVRTPRVPLPAPVPPMALPLRALRVWRQEGASALLRRSLGFVRRLGGGRVA
jgi:glycosyltransferase involved in cell wall biosynthesis